MSRDTVTFEITIVAQGAKSVVSGGFNRGSHVLNDYTTLLEANSKNAGSYSATITALSGSNNYTLTGAENASKSWTLLPAKLNLSNLSDILILDYGNGSTTPFVYNATPQTVEVKVKNSFKTDAFLTQNVEYTTTGVTQTNAGNYIATVKLVETGNYIFTNNLGDDKYTWTIEWQITRLYVDLQWNYEDDSFTGSNKYVGAIVTNVQGVDSVNVISYSTDIILGAHDYSSTTYTNVAINVGKYFD
jgi:hypothetical protein